MRGALLYSSVCSARHCRRADIIKVDFLAPSKLNSKKCAQKILQNISKILNKRCKNMQKKKKKKKKVKVPDFLVCVYTDVVQTQLNFVPLHDGEV